MILAAGLGTRLRPLTDRVPKALVEVGGVPMIERVARRLIDAGADRLIVNLHHLGDQVREYVISREGWGIEVLFSEEPDRPLETGGGLLRASPLLRGDAPFILHNSDVVSDMPLREMYERHLATAPLATLAVMDRETSRKFLFDDQGLLGRIDTRKELELRVREPEGQVRALAFSGVHVIDPALIDRLKADGRAAFSILDPYLEAVKDGERVLPYRIDGYRWTDIGSVQQLERARRDWAD